ncbi:hypothetical protein ACFE04_010854 [Oxalis oulophora]
MEKGLRRWIVDISRWDPSPFHFNSALSLLPPHQHASILSFVRMEDRKRALVSRLLQYALVHQVLGIPLNEIIITRTLEGKPYLENSNVGLLFPNFNFNVSHHGDYVAIASEPLCLVGLDIVSYSVPRNETVQEFIRNFTSYFTCLEWNYIVNAGDDDDILIQFYRYWCMKESFIKAIGSGVGFGLERVEIHQTNWTNISIKIDGETMKDWRFWVSELDKRHWVCVARGHLRLAEETYKKTLTRTEFDEEEYHKGLHLPNNKFISKTMEELISILIQPNK